VTVFDLELSSNRPLKKSSEIKKGAEVIGFTSLYLLSALLYRGAVVSTRVALLVGSEAASL